MAKRLHLVHVKSSVADKAPSASAVTYGEIAINYNEESPAIYIKDDADNMVKFIAEPYFEKIVGTGITENDGVTITPLTQVIEEDEETVSAALNDLNTRKADKDYVDEAISSITITVDDHLDSASTNPVENRLIYRIVAEDEKIIAASLTDLDTRVNKKYELPGTGIPASDLESGLLVVERGAGTNSVQQVGTSTYANGQESFSEGYSNLSNGRATHAEGMINYVGNDTSKQPASSDTQLYNTLSAGSHVEGQGNAIVNASYSHIEGCRNKIYKDANTTVKGAHVEGKQNLASGNYAHVEGLLNKVFQEEGHAEGFQTEVQAMQGHAEGWYTLVGGRAGHAEGYNTQANGLYSHAEGQGTFALNQAAHAEGEGSNSVGQDSHAEGYNTKTGGSDSDNTLTPGTYTNTGAYAHAEGNATLAKAIASHTEGEKTFATGRASHAEGCYTKTTNTGEHAEGNWNVSNPTTISSIGIGTSEERKNAFEVMTNGDQYVYGIGDYSGNNYSNSSSIQEVINGKADKTYVDDIIIENEEIVASALVDLDNRKADKEYVDEAVSSITFTVDDHLDSASTNPVENRAIYDWIVEDEKTISAAINDVNDRKADKTYVDDEIASALSSILPPFSSADAGKVLSIDSNGRLIWVSLS